MDVLQFLSSAFHPRSPLPLEDAPHSASVVESVAPPAQEISGRHIFPFSPYAARVPWHTGPRAFLSRLFPKYGNYCGPNWSSARDHGSLLWDKRPVDSVDYCCFNHDVGYDSCDQHDLHKADIMFLKCLEMMPDLGDQIRTSRSSLLSGFYRAASITGLRALLIPYRWMLISISEVKLRSNAEVTPLPKIRNEGSSS